MRLPLVTWADKIKPSIKRSCLWVGIHFFYKYIYKKYKPSARETSGGIARRYYNM